MNTPKSIKQAFDMGYKIKKVLPGNFGRNRVDMVPRFPNRELKSIVSFWITYLGCKRLQIYTDY